MADYVQVTTVIDDQDTATQIARAVVADRLAACAQVGSPIASTYRWEGATQTDTEYPIVCKTRGDLADALTARIAELHTYDVPEVLVTEILGGHRPYLDWVTSETRDA